MRTLDATAIAYLASAEAPNWCVAFDWVEGEMGGAQWPVIGGTTYYRILYTSRDVSGTPTASYEYGSRLNADSIRSIGWQIRSSDPGGVEDSSSVNFTIDNRDNHFNDLEAEGIRLEGVCVQISILPDSIGTTYANRIVVWTGYCKDIQVDRDKITVKAENYWRRVSRKIPTRVFNNDLSGFEDYHFKESVIGKPIPLVFGHHDMAEAIALGETFDDGAADQGMVLCPVDVVPNGSTRNIDSLDELRFGNSGLVEATGGFAVLNNASGKSQWYTSLPNGLVYMGNKQPDYLYVKMFVRCRSVLRNDAKAAGVTNHENAIDEDGNTYASVPGATNHVSDPGRQIGMRVPKVGLSGVVEGSVTNQQIYFVGKITPSAGGWNHDQVPPPQGRYWGAGVDYGGIDVYNTYTPNWTPFNATPIDNWDTPANWELYQLKGRSLFGLPTQGFYDSFDDMSKWWFHVGVNTRQSGATSGTLSVYQAALWVHGRINWPGKGIYVDMGGYEDYIGVYTGTAGLLIENCADVAFFIWANFGSKVYSGSRRSDGGDAWRALRAGDRANWDVARQVTKKIEMSELLESLSRETLMWHWLDHNGRFAVFTSTEDQAYDEYPIVPGKSKDLSWKLARMEDLGTHFTFRFKTNPVTNDFDGVILCNPDEVDAGLGASYQTMCADALAFTGDVPVEIEYDLEWVRERSVALLIAAQLIPWHTRRRYEISWKAELDALAVNLGTAVRISDVAGGWNHVPQSLRDKQYKVSSVKILPPKNEIHFKAVEVI